MKNEKSKTGTTQANDNVNNNVHYDAEGNITREDERDAKDSTNDWNAEESRTSRHR
ncbi:hypothetical protein [Flavobacterium rhizosphaerae]|uniref:Uncharacterized protein n=1 Tax=Flavobacterium rhizosphaerae TaxID=3163298 RepID=A0ABW8YT06_9FLAO